MNFFRTPFGIHARILPALLALLLGLSGCAHQDRAVAPTAPTTAPSLAATDSLRLTVFKLIRDGAPARAVELLDEALAGHPEDAEFPLLGDEFHARLSWRPLCLDSLEPSEQAAYSESRQNLLLAERE